MPFESAASSMGGCHSIAGILTRLRRAREAEDRLRRSILGRGEAALGTCEQEPLEGVAAQELDMVALRRGLDALDDQLDVQVSAQRRDRSYQLPLDRGGFDAPDQRHVGLD